MWCARLYVAPIVPDDRWRIQGVWCARLYVAHIVPDDRMENTRSVVCQVVILLLWFQMIERRMGQL